MLTEKLTADRRRMVRGIVIIAAAACAVLVATIVFESLVRPDQSTSTTPLVLGGGTSRTTTYNLDVAADEASQEKGLGGRSSLGSHSGMLFSYDAVAQRCFWMKDMRFNIDIVWFDNNHHVTSIVQNLSPHTYPQTYCAAARYIVELPLGTATLHGLQIGQTVRF
jgi:uncharacterized membrane protein (UPF0127 family)